MPPVAATLSTLLLLVPSHVGEADSNLTDVLYEVNLRLTAVCSR